jgi:hypothetical protein
MNKPPTYTYHELTPERFQINQGSRFIGIRKTEEEAIRSCEQYNREEEEYFKQHGYYAAF